MATPTILASGTHAAIGHVSGVGKLMDLRPPRLQLAGLRWEYLRGVAHPNYPAAFLRRPPMVCQFLDQFRSKQLALKRVLASYIPGLLLIVGTLARKRMHWRRRLETELPEAALAAESPAW